MPAIWVFIAAILGSIIARVLTAIGLGFVTFQGVGALLEEFMLRAEAAFGDMAETTISILAIARVDEALSLIIGAYVLRYTFKGMASGALVAAQWAGPFGSNQST